MSEYSTRLKLSQKMSDVIIESNNNIYTWLEGSAQCGKSVTAALAISLIIENAPKEDSLFLALGYTLTSVKNNVFECGGFGVRSYFGERAKPVKYLGIADALKIQTRTGTKYLVGFGTSTKTSNNTWHGWRVSGFIIDEIDRACQESIDEMQQRITTIKNPHVIVTQNPNIEKHPIYEFLGDLQKRGLVYYTHWTLDDNIAMTQEQIQSVKDRYEPNSPYYKRYILGQRVNPESQIYTIRDYNILHDYKPEDYLEYIIVCDQGESLSASVFVLAALKYEYQKHEYQLDILKQYYYKNQDKYNAQVKMFKDTAIDLANFVKESMDLMKKYPSQIYIDQDPEFYRNCELEFRKLEMDPGNIRYVIKDQIEQRLKSGLNLLYKGKLRFHESCKEIIDDFKQAVYDKDSIEKKGIFNRLKEYNELGHCDGIDAVEYSFTHYKEKLYI